jgi:hypothetical protein
MLFFDIVTTIGYALSPAMNESLHAALVPVPSCVQRGSTDSAVDIVWSVEIYAVLFSNKCLGHSQFDSRKSPLYSAPSEFKYN